MRMHRARLLIGVSRSVASLCLVLSRAATPALRFPLGLLHKLVASVSSVNTPHGFGRRPQLRWASVVGFLFVGFSVSGSSGSSWGFVFGAGFPVRLWVWFFGCWFGWFCFTLHARPRCIAHRLWATSWLAGSETLRTAMRVSE